MKKFLASKKGIVCVCIVSLVLLALSGAGGYAIWRANQPRFHDLTVELGTDSIEIEQFTTRFADPKKASFVTDVGALDITKPGTTSLTLRCGSREETVRLTIQDTTPPQVTFIPRVTMPAGETPDPNAFIESISDLSATAVSFRKPVEIPKEYGDISVCVVVEDAGGNQVEQTCVLCVTWMRPELSVEFGKQLTKADILIDPERDGDLIDQAQIDAVNEGGIGEYVIHSQKADDKLMCKVTVRDTTPPELELKPVSVYLGVRVTLEDFVVSATDASGDVTLRFVSEPDVWMLGTQQIEIEATDLYGNQTVRKAVLTVAGDEDPPQISGMSAMAIEKNWTPDYLSGVSAWDAVDGACSVGYDAGAVDITTAGVYYVEYYATDSTGNTGYARRKVTVLHDQADTDALVKRLASQLSSDPEALRDYVRNTIYYTPSWGGDDPVWFGYQNLHGNCYVHAMCLDALLKENGYTTQIIHTTDKTHYWLLIYLGGAWRHIDPTPSTIHSRYSLMTDAQRLETLSGRDWDRSAWPACE